MTMQEPESSDANAARGVRWLFAGILAATVLLTALLIWFGSGKGRHPFRGTPTPVPAKEAAREKELRRVGEETALEGILLAPTPPTSNP